MKLKAAEIIAILDVLFTIIIAIIGWRWAAALNEQNQQTQRNLIQLQTDLQRKYGQAQLVISRGSYEDIIVTNNGPAFATNVRVDIILENTYKWSLIDDITKLRIHTYPTALDTSMQLKKLYDSTKNNAVELTTKNIPPGTSLYIDISSSIPMEYRQISGIVTLFDDAPTRISSLYGSGEPVANILQQYIKTRLTNASVEIASTCDTCPGPVIYNYYIISSLSSWHSSKPLPNTPTSFWVGSLSISYGVPKGSNFIPMQFPLYIRASTTQYSSDTLNADSQASIYQCDPTSTKRDNSPCTA